MRQSSILIFLAIVGVCCSSNESRQVEKEKDVPWVAAIVKGIGPRKSLREFYQQLSNEKSIKDFVNVYGGSDLGGSWDIYVLKGRGREGYAVEVVAGRNGEEREDWLLEEVVFWRLHKKEGKTGSAYRTRVSPGWQNGKVVEFDSVVTRSLVGDSSAWFPESAEKTGK